MKEKDFKMLSHLLMVFRYDRCNHLSLVTFCL